MVYGTYNELVTGSYWMLLGFLLTNKHHVWGPHIVKPCLISIRCRSPNVDSSASDSETFGGRFGSGFWSSLRSDSGHAGHVYLWLFNHQNLRSK